MQLLTLSVLTLDSDCLIYFAQTSFGRAKETYVHEMYMKKMEETTIKDINFSDFSSFIFSVMDIFTEKEDNPSDKIVIVEEELQGIKNLQDSPRLVFINEGCESLKVIVDVV